MTTIDQAWSALSAHAEALQDVHLRHLFDREPERFQRRRAQVGELFIDCSKHLATEETDALLCDLARAADVEGRRDAMFAGEHINVSEGRAVGHVALRNQTDQPFMIDGTDVMPSVRRELDRMRAFCASIHDGTWTGHSGKKITDVVNIGIGGSDLGPVMVTEALRPFARPDLACHFVSNVDPAHICDTLANLDPETTLFIVASKTFGTLETLTNARVARRWLLDTVGSEEAVARHFVALSTNVERVTQFGIDPDNMFVFWDWVGGRYSLWSAIGLSIALAVGFDRFEALLEGAHEMDEHFRNTPLESNVPIRLGLLDCWYRNCHDMQSIAVLPYDQHLHRLPAYLQQAMMESNGKHVNLHGQRVSQATSPVLWGEPGTNGQHAFHQMLHQGTTRVPCDFIVAMESHTSLGEQHLDLVANCIAQSEAMMRGRTDSEVREELAAMGMAVDQIDAIAPHKVMEGNRPSTTMLYPRLTPHMLGMLIALYEHRIFTAAAVWGIDAFDQWGVELGKSLAVSIRPMLSADESPSDRDASTIGLIELVRQHAH
ncbi:MAG: glucose-6-phosphate isomerase [Phycisphaerales bacterium]|nr:glucose-6-phosphate isomerase [Phycisphaerales bacterium]